MRYVRMKQTGSRDGARTLRLPGDLARAFRDDTEFLPEPTDEGVLFRVVRAGGGLPDAGSVTEALRRLGPGEHGASEVAREMGEPSGRQVAPALREAEVAGAVRRGFDGRHITYRLDENGGA